MIISLYLMLFKTLLSCLWDLVKKDCWLFLVMKARWILAHLYDVSWWRLQSLKLLEEIISLMKLWRGFRLFSLILFEPLIDLLLVRLDIQLCLSSSLLIDIVLNVFVEGIEDTVYVIINRVVTTLFTMLLVEQLWYPLWIDLISICEVLALYIYMIQIKPLPW